MRAMIIAGRLCDTGVRGVSQPGGLTPPLPGQGEVLVSRFQFQFASPGLKWHRASGLQDIIIQWLVLIDIDPFN